ncbi:MAG TPA: cytochrome c biogenesis protein CcsA [Candidatus Polarisedimenticolia bacterium]|nr:cytochrome c biogenesis protein CcsA [Candidatus Polarisedimenticolia bacterium]
MLQRLPLTLAALAVPLALRQAFLVAPTEQKMGVVQRIFYFHVPSAMMAFLGVGLCAVLSALYLWRRDRRLDAAAEAAAELGLLFCTIVLVTGPIWARPVWGVWWTGEVRLTSTLILWLLFVGYLLLRGQAGADRDATARFAAIVAIVGALDVPIIYKSVEWWRGLHPKVLKISGGGGLDPAMGRSLLVCSLAFLLLFAALYFERLRLGRLALDVADLEERSARLEERAGTPA